MPERETIRRARRDAQHGKAPSTQAGEFAREQVHHLREGKHGARSTKQAIAIGLSKARRAGVKVPRRKRSTSAKTKRVGAGALETRGAQKRPQWTRGLERALRVLAAPRGGPLASDLCARGRPAGPHRGGSL
jgi:hypothetical protein